MLAAGDDEPNLEQERARSQEIEQLFSRCLRLSPDDRESLLESLRQTQPALAIAVCHRLRDLDRPTNDLTLGRPAIHDMSLADTVSQVTPVPVQQVIEPAQLTQPPVSPSHFFSKPVSHYVFAVTNALTLAIFCFSVFLVLKYGEHSVDPGWAVDATRSGWIVDDVTRSGPAWRDLQVGDHILAVNNISTEMVTVPAALATIPPNAGYSLRVLRRGVILQATLVNAVLADKDRLGRIASSFVVSFCFCFAGMLISAFKPDARVTRFGYAALTLTGLATLRAAISGYAGFLNGFALTGYALLFACDGIHLAAGYHFYTVFFGSLRNVRGRNFVVPVIYAWAIVLSASRFITTGALSSPFLNHHLGVLEQIQSWGPLLYVIAPLAICSVAVFHYPGVTQPDERRRARWIVVGSVAGLAPFIAIRALLLISAHTGDWLPAHAGHIGYRIGSLATALIPITTTYAILRHQTFDIYVVIRRSLQYKMLRRVLQALVVFPAAVLLVSLITQSQMTVADALWRNRLSLGLVVLFGSTLALRSSLGHWLDKRFFREVYNGEEIYLALVDGLKRAHSLEELARTVGVQVTKALHPKRFVALLIDEWGQTLHSVYDSQTGGVEITLAEKSTFASALSKRGEGDDITSIRNQLSDRSDAERLIALGLEFAVPLKGKAGDLAGVLLLGPKLSEESYSPEDRKLLGVIAHLSIAEKIEELLQSPTRLRHCPRCLRCFGTDAARCPSDGETLTEGPQIPRILENRYRMDHFIGKGGMGSVYAALDSQLKCSVAIKILTEELKGEDKESRSEREERAKREIRAALQLIHPNIVSTHDFGTTKTGVFYLVMELIVGETFRDVLSRGLQSPLLLAVWFDQLLNGLEAAHLAGVIHRDLKPENIIITKDGDSHSLVKILDFGIAKLTRGPGSRNVTMPGSLLGSLNYMSPEQRAGEQADERSDLFSVGMMIYEALTGRLPLERDVYGRSFLSARPQLPVTDQSDELLDAALRKCLAIEPKDRFSTAAELREAIVPLIRDYKRYTQLEQTAASA